MPDYGEFSVDEIQGYSVKNMATTLLTLVLVSDFCYSTKSVLVVL